VRRAVLRKAPPLVVDVGSTAGLRVDQHEIAPHETGPGRDALTRDDSEEPSVRRETRDAGPAVAERESPRPPDEPILPAELREMERHAVVLAPREEVAVAGDDVRLLRPQAAHDAPRARVPEGDSEARVVRDPARDPSRRVHES